MTVTEIIEILNLIRNPTTGQLMPFGQAAQLPGSVRGSNRALALCTVAIRDEIADICTNAQGERAADYAELQDKIAEGVIDIKEINEWVRSNEAVTKRAQEDIEALGNGLALAALGEDLGQESVSADMVNVLLAKHAYATTESRILAKIHFDEQRFNEITDVAARRKTILDAQVAAGTPTTIIDGLSINTSRVYRDLLAKELGKLEAAIKAAQARFNTHNFTGITDLRARLKAVEEAHSALNADMLQVYSALLFEERAKLDTAVGLGQARFTEQRFDEETSLARRLARIETALTPAALRETQLSDKALTFYQSLLTQAQTAVKKTIAQAISDSHTAPATLAELARETKLESELLAIIVHPSADEAVLTAVTENTQGARTARVDTEITKQSRTGPTALTSIVQRTQDVMDLIRIYEHARRTPEIIASITTRRGEPVMLSQAALQVVHCGQRAERLLDGLPGQYHGSLGTDILKRMWGW